MTHKTLSLFGATGSVGQSCLEYIRAQGGFKLDTLSAHTQHESLVALALEFTPRCVVIAPEAYGYVKEVLAHTSIEVLAGEDALVACAGRKVDVVLNAIVGFSGLAVSLAALEAGQTLALANKESLVVAGELMMQTAHTHKATLLPVDSEHSAVFQLLQGQQTHEIAKVTLTASGGPFRGLKGAQLKHVTPEQALKHPTWSMGAKISIDSASLMNKGLELIEAKYLFGLNAKQLDVIVHPQSLVHAIVHFQDGQNLMHACHADMKFPISYALNYPQRPTINLPNLDLAQMGALEFAEPDRDTFACLALAEYVMAQNGGLEGVLNAANEVAVQLFLQKRISFLEIAKIVEQAINHCELKGYHKVPESLACARFVDHDTREFVLKGFGDVQRLAI